MTISGHRALAHSFRGMLFSVSYLRLYASIHRRSMERLGWVLKRTKIQPTEQTEGTSSTWPRAVLCGALKLVNAL